MFAGYIGIMVAHIRAATEHSVVLCRSSLGRKKILEIVNGDDVSRLATRRLGISETAEGSV